MKKSTKIWLSVGIVLVIIGVIGFAGVMHANNWNFNTLGNNEYETRTLYIHEGFENISIYSDTTDITFQPSESGECHIVIYDHPQVEYTAAVQNNTLTIRRNDSRKWSERFTILSESSTVTVYLPETAYHSLQIEESTGDVTLPKNFTFENIGITVSTGDISCQASAKGQIGITTDTGNITCENLSAGKLTLAVTTGRVTVTSVSCEGELAVSVSTGKTFLTGISCKSLTSTGNTGDMTLQNVLVTDLLEIVRTTGDIRLNKCDAGELLIDTDTGDVTGTLLSDKVFIAKSDTGHIDVPETTSGGKCKITTDTGDIQIKIE